MGRNETSNVVTSTAVKKEDVRKYKSGASSSVKPHFELIPYEALVALANRFQLGLDKYGSGAWNALSPNQRQLDDDEWIESRLSHIIHHAYQIIMKRRGLIPDDCDDDAAAIMWGGACLVMTKYGRVKDKDVD